jgi:BolA protein
MEIAARIRAKLTEALTPERIDIVDESHLHAGHAGHDRRGESHFNVTVVSSAFEGLGRVARHRMVNEVLAEELRDRVHALALKTLTPAEDARTGR